MLKLALVAIVAITLTAVLWRTQTISPERVQVFLHNRGTTSAIDPGATHFKALVEACEESLTSSDPGRMLREAVFPETIEKIKSEELSIELVFPRPQDFEIGKSKGRARSVRLDRMLIPLSGERAETATGKYVTIFYGVGRYGPGPYTNESRFQEGLRKLLKDMGYSLH
jgi:hypothetical protein